MSSTRTIGAPGPASGRASRHFGFGSAEECLDFIAHQILRTISGPWKRIVVSAAIRNEQAQQVSIVRTDDEGSEELEQQSGDAYDLVFTDLAELFELTHSKRINQIGLQLFEDGNRVITTK